MFPFRPPPGAQSAPARGPHGQDHTEVASGPWRLCTQVSHTLARDWLFGRPGPHHATVRARATGRLDFQPSSGSARPQRPTSPPWAPFQGLGSQVEGPTPTSHRRPHRLSRAGGAARVLRSPAWTGCCPTPHASWAIRPGVLSQAVWGHTRRVRGLPAAEETRALPPATRRSPRTCASGSSSLNAFKL